MKKALLGLEALATIAILVVQGLLPAVNAQTTPQTGNSGLQISPTRTDLSVSPGESNTFQITIKNVTSITTDANAVLNDFTADGETGTPKLIVDPTKHSDRSIKGFITGLSNYTLAPGESKNINLTVNIPKNTAPGGYYGAIRFSAIPHTSTDNGQRQISLTASVASLVLIEVNGAVNQSMSLNYVQLLHKTKPSTVFLGTHPDHIAIRLTNEGNGFAQPIGQVSIKKGSKTVQEYEFNSNSPGVHGDILPNSTRTFTDVTKGVSSFGHYTLTANLAYGQGGATTSVQKSFWVIPLVLLYILAILVAILVLAALALAYKKRKS